MDTTHHSSTTSSKKKKSSSTTKFPDVVWTHLALLKNLGKTFQESEGEIKTLASFLTGGSDPSSRALRHAWDGKTYNHLTKFPRVEKKKMPFSTWSKMIAKREQKEGARFNDRSTIEKALRMIILSKTDAEKKNTLPRVSVSNIAEVTGLSAKVVRSLKSRKSWSNLYDMIELEIMAE